MFEKIGAQLDIVGQCKRYGLSVWQCPQFLFVVMGVFIILASVVSYLIGARYILSPETVIFIVVSINYHSNEKSLNSYFRWVVFLIPNPKPPPTP